MNFKKILALSLLAISLASCNSTRYRVNYSKYSTESFNERIRFIVVHYTALNDERSIKALTENNVSSHYLITQNKKDDVYSLLADHKRAWHAGESSFGGFINLNDNSIGIEISNLGYTTTDPVIIENLKNGIIDTSIFYTFDSSQIFKVGMLLKELTGKYNISPKHVLGHSDISPTRKLDPGPNFPWKLLYDKYGVGAWYETSDFNEFNSKELFETYSISDLKNELRTYGYDINFTDEWDKESRQVVSAFQLHFRPSIANGEFDLETFAIIKALNKKYK